MPRRGSFWDKYGRHVGRVILRLIAGRADPSRQVAYWRERAERAEAALARQGSARTG